MNGADLAGRASLPAEAQAPSRRVQTGAQTLERGLDVLERIAEKPIKLSALIAQTRLSKTTTRRLSQALINRKFVALTPSGELRAGPKLLQLGHYEQNINLLHIARPELDRLAAETGHSAFLGRREQDYSVHLYRSTGAERVSVTTPAGSRRRLAETSLGRALLLDEGEQELKAALAAAELSVDPADWLRNMQIAAQEGVIFNEGPPPDCIHAVAAPVRNAAGLIEAAVSIASAASYLDTARMHALAPTIRATANRISRLLGWVGD